MRTRNFRQNQEGIILPLAIAISFIIMSSIIWLVGALIVGKTFDAFAPWFAISDPRALIVAQNAVNAYGVSIIVVDILFLVWAGLSAQKRESQESSAMPY